MPDRSEAKLRLLLEVLFRALLAARLLALGGTILEAFELWLLGFPESTLSSFALDVDLLG